MPLPLIIIGFILAVGSLAGAYWLASFACSMHPAGCNTDGPTLFMNLMFSGEGLFFWAGFAAGVMFLLIGLRGRVVLKDR